MLIPHIIWRFYPEYKSGNDPHHYYTSHSMTHYRTWLSRSSSRGLDSLWGQTDKQISLSNKIARSR